MAVAGCSEGAVSAEPKMVPELEYRPGLSLDVFAPLPAEGAMPVAVVLHGAGLDRTPYRPFARRIAEQGVVVFNIDWTVLRTAAGLRDVGCAVRFAAHRSPEWGGDPGRITLVAHSTAVATAGAVAVSENAVLEDCPHDPGPALVGLVAVSPFQVVGGEVWPRTLLGGNPDLRIRLVEGTEDPLVRPGSSERTVDILTEAGYETDLVLVDGGHHDIVLVDIGDEPDLGGAEATLEAVGEILLLPARAVAPPGTSPTPRSESDPVPWCRDRAPSRPGPRVTRNRK